MKISCFLGILVQLCMAKAKHNSTQNNQDVVHRPRTEPTAEPKTPIWYYFPIPIGILVLLLIIVVLYTSGKRRAAKRRRRAERPTMHVSEPVEGTMASLMGNASVDVVAVNAHMTGKPQLKAKMLQTFNEEERLKNSFEYGINDDSDNALGPLEDYEYVDNGKGLNYGQDSCTTVPQPNFKGYHNRNTSTMPGRVENAALKKMPFIPPAISVELVRKQTEQDYQIERGNRNRAHGALLPDWGRGKEELLYENQNSTSVRAAKSFDNFREQGVEQPPLYVNNTQVMRMKKEKSAENINENLLVPELPLKQKLRRTDGVGAHTQTWEKGRSTDYENFFGGEHCAGGSWQRGAIYQKNKNRAHFIGQGTEASKVKEGVDYENAPSFGGNFLPRKQEISASCGLQTAPKVTLLESRRRSPGFTRAENKAVRRSRSNVEAMLKPAGVVESKESLSSENRQTNTAGLMHMLGLPINISCSDQVQTFEDDTYVPMDDYDDNRA